MSIENIFEANSSKYLEKGFSIIPVGRNKVPLIKWEKYQKEKPAMEEIREWTKTFGNCNIGIVTGSVSGIVVVDIEAGGGVDNFPPTVTVKTGGGGFHLYYKHPGFPVGNAVRLYEKTDIRGDGGYVVAPPSIHGSGNQYEWLVSPEDSEFAELPQWILDKMGSKKEGERNWQEFLTTENQEGTRNMSTAQIAGKILYHLPTDLWELVGLEAIRGWNISRNKPPLEETELRNTWESIKKREVESRAKRFQEIKMSEPRENRPSIEFQTLEEIIGKWLLIKDKGLLRILLASVIANKLQADPVWLFIVAAPGGTKTELIRGLNKIEGIYPISDLTPQTFLSGDKGKTSSLLLRLPAGTIFTYKDFTTVLSMHRDKQQAIISQLREIFDGYYRKEFGTGETKTWEGKIGFIAGVTSVIDKHYEVYSVLGERFIQYRPVQPDCIALAKKAISNSGGEKAMRNDIQNAVFDFVNGIKIPEEKILVSDELEDRIAHLAAFCVRARSGIIRDGYSTREIELIPDTELPTRLAKQLITLSSALSLVGSKDLEEDYELIWKVAMDSLPQKRRSIIETLVKASEELETAQVATKIGYPTNTTRRVLEDLCGLKLINRNHQGAGHADKWKISNYTKTLLERAAPKNMRIGISPEEPKSESLPEMSGEIKNDGFGGF